MLLPVTLIPHFLLLRICCTQGFKNLVDEKSVLSCQTHPSVTWSQTQVWFIFCRKSCDLSAGNITITPHKGFKQRISSCLSDVSKSSLPINSDFILLSNRIRSLHFNAHVSFDKVVFVASFEADFLWCCCTLSFSVNCIPRTTRVGRRHWLQTVSTV